MPRPESAKVRQTSKSVAVLVIALLVIGLQNPVRQPLGAGAQYLVLERTHDRAITLGQFIDDGAREGGIAVEYVAHGLRRDHEDLRRRERARRLEIDLVADNRGQDECRHRPHDLDCGLVPIMGAEHFDRTFDDDMQEVRQIAFVDQNGMQRKALQECGADQLLEIRIAHIAEQRQRADELPIGLTHGDLQNAGFGNERYQSRASASRTA